MEAGSGLKLTVEEQAQITSAVQAVERRTNAEIVPMLVARSGLYRDAQYQTGLIAALLVLAVLLTCETWWLPWGWHASNAAWLVCAVILAYAGGAKIGTWAPVIRLLTSQDRMQQKVIMRAERAFAQHVGAQTRDHTGVLIMLSMLEKHIYVLPDRSLAEQVAAERWKHVVQAAVERLHQDDIVGGLSQAIHACGSVLAEACPDRPGDNPNELPDTVIQE